MNGLYSRSVVWNLIGLLFLSGGTILIAQEKITVRKMGNDFVVRSEFSPEYDLVLLNYRYANEGAYLLPKNIPLKDYNRKGLEIHRCSDEYPAILTASLGTISGNHGSRFGRTLLIPNHQLTTADIGGKVTERNGYPYVIMQIIDKDNILIHPYDESCADDSPNPPKFRDHYYKNPLYYKGKALPFRKSTLTQLFPLNRITDFRLLANGKTPVPDHKDIVCDYVDFIFVHDVISPNAAVRSVLKNPGRKSSPEWGNGKKCFMALMNTPALRDQYPEYMKLPAVLTCSNRFRFEARGANVMYRKAVFHSRLKGVKDLSVMFGWFSAIAKKKNQYFYIPKMKPVQMKGIRKEDPVLYCDFTANYLMPREMNVNVYSTKQDCINPEDMPDRFIRVTGDNEPELGIAVGYSLLNGCTAKARKGMERDIFYHFYKTYKMYPYACTLSETSPGKTIEIVCYKQYFNPRLEPDATSFYYHREGNSWLVYLDFHKELKNKLIRLPGHMAGRKITVVEKTQSLTLHAGKTVPAEGIRLDVAGKHGYLVLKLD